MEVESVVNLPVVSARDTHTLLLVRCSNHFATWTEMMSEGYICVQPVTLIALTIGLHGLR